ncbi:hypothetical protein ACUOFC_30240, partial [Escherichia sp. TWPC-MK]
TLNTSLQFSFGEELSGSIDLPILAKITGKFSAQQIINAGISKFSSNENCKLVFNVIESVCLKVLIAERTV